MLEWGIGVQPTLVVISASFWNCLLPLHYLETVSWDSYWVLLLMKFVRPYHEIEVVNLFLGFFFSDVNLDIHICMVGILQGVFSKPGNTYQQTRSQKQIYRAGAMAQQSRKDLCCSYRGPEFGSQQPHRGLQPSVNSSSGESSISVLFWSLWANRHAMWCIYIYASKKFIHIKVKK